MRAVLSRRIPVALLAAFLLFAGRARFAAAADDFTPIPSVVDRPLEEARAALMAEGLLVATVDVAGTPANTVAAQSPAPETQLPRGAVVILDVRVASEVAPAPKVVGLSAAEASNAFGSLYALRFVAGPPTPGKAGQIVAQDPAMGAPLALHGALTLTFAPNPALPAMAVVPDVSGLPPADAAQAFAAVGLYARISHISLPGVPADVVIGQIPLPGTEAPLGSAVNVVVTVAPPEGPAGEPALVTVPNLMGMSESSARAALEDVELNAAVEWVDGAPEQAFLVISQEPAAEESLPVGKEVRLRIGKYVPPPPASPIPPSQVSMPSLVGMSQAQAEDLLASLDLVPNPSFLANSSVPPLRVFAQQLAVGSLVPIGTQVSFRVSMPPAPPQSVPVPQLFGKSKGQALALASLAGLSLQIMEVTTNAHVPHRVFSQSIAPWSHVPLGTSLVVKLARPPSGPAHAVVPDLTGKTKVQAMALLGLAGLSSDPSDVFTLDHPPYRVFDQAPNAGITVPAGTIVHFKLAKTPPNAVTVPAVLGATKAAAVAAVLAAGLSPQAVEIVAPGKPVGLVYEQFPDAGTKRLPGTTVLIRIAKPITIPVPNLFGMTVNQAAAALGPQLVGNPVFVVAPLKPGGRVFDQSPNFGALVMPGSVVSYKVAKIGGGAVLVGNYIGMSRVQAIAAVQSVGLVANVIEVPKVVGPFGTVVQQSVASGASVPFGTQIGLRVYVPPGGGNPSVVVPNLIGRTPFQAKQLLESIGLVSQGIKFPWPGKPPGKVYAQNATVGSHVAQGTTITWRWTP